MAKEKLEDKFSKELEEKFYRLLSETKREGMDGVIEYMKREDAGRCPASTKLGRHGAYPGGLIEHSYNTYTLFKEKNKRFNLCLEEDTVKIVSLLHDICKVGSYEENILKDGKISEKKPYNYRDKLPYGHGEKSVYVLMREGLKLTDDEALMIRWHMGAFDSQWLEFETGTKVKEKCPATIAFQCADYEASVYLDH